MTKYEKNQITNDKKNRALLLWSRAGSSPLAAASGLKTTPGKVGSGYILKKSAVGPVRSPSSADLATTVIPN